MPWTRAILTQARALWHPVFAAVLTFLALTSAAAPPAQIDPLQEALHERIEELRAGRGLQADGGYVDALGLIPAFYERREFHPVWMTASRRDELIALVERSRSHGLDPADYQLDALRRAAAQDPRDPRMLADRDLLFTDSLVRLAYHLRYGKVNPRELHADWNFPRTAGQADPVQALQGVVDAESLTAAVEGLAPRLEAYQRLRAALARYRQLAVAGGWPQVPPGATLRLGDRDPRVAVLRERLQVTGDLDGPPPAEGAEFDAAVDGAVKAFQRRHGLRPDGAVGPRTLAALNVDVGRRIDQIRVNLERLRWVAQDVDRDYLLVDIAGFDAELYLDRRLAWRSRVVVGRPYRKTPIFRATLQYLVINPSWVVPPTILREDVVPKVARDPDYLAKNGMRVEDGTGRPVAPASIDWARYADGSAPFPYRIEQGPGAENPLGRIKFMLPNPYMVYLHDTPAKRLFERVRRAFSSGCIRVERPFDLALRLLDDPGKWDGDTLRAAIERGQTLTVPVRRRVPVLLLYHTAAVADDGAVDFRPDLYDYDGEVLRALAGPFRFSALDRAGMPGRP